MSETSGNEPQQKKQYSNLKDTFFSNRLPDIEKRSLIEFLQEKSLQTIEAGSDEPLLLDREILPGVYPAHQTIEHRLQKGGTCLLESLHRTLSAIGVTISPDVIVQSAIDNGMYDEKDLAPIERHTDSQDPSWETLQDMIRILGFETKIKTSRVIPDEEAVMKVITRISAGKHSKEGTQPRSTDLLTAKVEDWLDMLDQEKAIILNIPPSRIRKYRRETEGTIREDRADKDGHAIALTGYTIDEQKRLRFTVYDSNYVRPVHLTPQHIADNQKGAPIYILEKQ